MSELRLVPADAVTWVVCLACLLTRSFWPGAVACAVLLVGLTALAAHAEAIRPAGRAASVRDGIAGQLVLCAALATAATLTAWARLRRATPAPPGELTGRLAAEAKETAPGTWLLRVRVPDRPVPVTAFVRDELSVLPAGTRVHLAATWRESDRPGVDPWVGNASLSATAEPEGLAGWAAHVHATLRAAVEAHVGESSQGLVPGMVLGDTSLQPPAEQQVYIDTGLSHLSAVSGANVTVVTAAAFLAVRLLGLGPRVQAGAAAAALAGFVLLVGCEPSVLRAAVTGCVGLLAVVGSARLEPAHGLALAVTGLLLWDTDLAVSWGFALSVAATAGIVAVFPALYRAIARPWLPDAAARALAVALAADVVTAPLIAGMAGRVSLVSVAANVVVAPAVAPVTVLGLLAAGLALAPGGLEAVPLSLLEPCTWWIHRVAEAFAGLPVATVAADPLWVVVCHGWLAWLVLTARPRAAGVLAAVLLAWLLL